MLRWKLNEVMAQKRMTSRRLAELVGVHENSIYRLRKMDEMPGIAPKTLNLICRYLDVQLSDLVIYEPDLEEENNS